MIPDVQRDIGTSSCWNEGVVAGGRSSFWVVPAVWFVAGHSRRLAPRRMTDMLVPGAVISGLWVILMTLVIGWVAPAVGLF
jgi:hypothetical protein